MYSRHVAWELLSHAEGERGHVDRVFDFFVSMAVILCFDCNECGKWGRINLVVVVNRALGFENVCRHMPTIALQT